MKTGGCDVDFINVLYHCVDLENFGKLWWSWISLKKGTGPIHKPEFQSKHSFQYTCKKCFLVNHLGTLLPDTLGTLLLPAQPPLPECDWIFEINERKSIPNGLGTKCLEAKKIQE